ncbi:hypothetical protein [Amycolatopsis anabasis]|nr:hypothetical protein [Amycolatopsis anabasis]
MGRHDKDGDDEGSAQPDKWTTWRGDEGDQDKAGGTRGKDDEE